MAHGGQALSAGQDLLLPDRYGLVRPIAEGGMASVWCARDRTLDRDVAVKLLARRFLSDEVAVRRFKREARTAARLSGHPNVVTIFDVGQAAPTESGPGQPFIVMEYLSGGTAAQALRLGTVSQAEAVRWLTQAAAALDYAHRRGVIHRDVKLSNFLVGRDRVLHVADFGIARLGTDDTLTAAGELIGTAAYLAPERALGQPATEASDRYALAVAGFELLVGERPFTAQHFAAQAHQHLEDPPPRASLRNPALPVALDAVLERGMAKVPEDRWPTATAFAQAVSGALALTAPAGSPLTTITRPLRHPPPPPPTRPQRARLAAGAALAAALVGLIIALAAAGSSGGPTARLLSGHGRAHAGRSQMAKPATDQATTGSAVTGPAAGAGALEARGHQLMASGDPQAAIPVLRRAVTGAPHASLTYAYALYDLGRSLVLAGDPQAAIPILRQRLTIPNQTGVVAAELQAALAAAGEAAPTPPARPAPGAKPGKGHGRGHDMGDGG